MTPARGRPAHRRQWRVPTIPSRSTSIASIASIVAFPIAMFHRALFGSRTLLYADALDYFLPIYRVVARTWLRGEIPTWNRYAFSGYPLLGSSQGGVFYLPNLLYELIDPRRAFAWLAVAHMAAGGLGARALAKRLWRSETAALASGLAYTCNAYAIGHIPHPAMWAASALLPWAVWSIDHFLRDGAWRWAALCAACLAAVAFNGHTQAFWIASTTTLVYGAALAWLLPGSGWVRIENVVRAGGTVLAGGALAAVQLIPTALYAQGSGRPRLTLGEAMTYSYPFSHLPLLTFPYVFGSTGRVPPYTDDYRGQWLARELIGYVGLAALVLAAAGSRRIWRRPEGRALLAVALFALVMLLGDSTPFGPLLFRTLPFFDRFRAWARHVLGLDLAVAVLAGAGVHAVLRRRSRPEAVRRATIAFGTLCLAGLVVPRWPGVQAHLPNPAVRTLAIVLPLAFAAGALGAAVVAFLDARVAAVLLVLVVAADGWVFAQGFEWRALTLPYRALDRHVSTGPPIWGATRDSPGGIDRFVTDVPLLQMSWVGRRILSLNGYDPVYPLDYATAVGEMVEFGGLRRADLWTTSPAIADLLRATTLLAQAGTSSPAPAPQPEWVPVGAVPGTPLIRYERDPRLPEAFVVGGAAPASFADAVRTLRNDPTVDPSTLVLYDGRCTACAGAATPGPAGRALGPVRWGESSAHLRVQADRDALVVVSQAWSKGWEATVDGRRAPVVRVFGLTMGVPVPPGAHEVRLRYAAPGLRLGFAVSSFTAAVLAVLCAAPALARRRHGRTRSRTRRPDVSAASRPGRRTGLPSPES